MMTTKQLRTKHKKERQKRKINLLINVIRMIVLVAVLAVGAELFFRGLDKEQEAHIQHNIEWQTKYGNNK